MYGVLKDIFSLKQKQTQNRKSEKSVEICKLWLFSVMISKLNGKTNKQTKPPNISRHGSALDLDSKDLDSGPSFIYLLAM